MPHGFVFMSSFFFTASVLLAILVDHVLDAASPSVLPENSRRGKPSGREHRLTASLHLAINSSMGMSALGSESEGDPRFLPPA